MRWFGHVERIGDERQVNIIMNATMEGRRPVIRARTRWKDVLQKVLDTVTGGEELCWPHATTMPPGAESSKSLQYLTS